VYDVGGAIPKFGVLIKHIVSPIEKSYTEPTVRGLCAKNEKEEIMQIKRKINFFIKWFLGAKCNTKRCTIDNLFIPVYN
jgi:hypothetical protein